jgi:hypothetical protein
MGIRDVSVDLYTFEDGGVSDKVHPRTAQRGSRGRALVFLKPRRQMAVCCQSHAPAYLPSGKRPATCCTRDWVGPKVGLDGCGKSRSRLYSILGPSSP